jgi:cytoskeletal protein RodZ
VLIRRDEHNIDKLFRKKLHDAQDDAPLHLWEDVRANNRRKRRVPLFWWWLGSAAVVGGLAFALVFQTKQSIETAANNQSTKVDVLSKPNSSENTQAPDGYSSANSDLNGSGEHVVIDANANSVSPSKLKETPTSTKDLPYIAKNETKQKEGSLVKSPLSNRDTSTEQLFDAVLNAFVQERSEPAQVGKPASTDESDASYRNALVPDPSIENEILSGLSQSWIQTNIPDSKEHWTTNRLMTGVGFSMANPVRKAAGGEDQGLFALDQRTRPETEITMGLGVGYRIWKGLAIWSGLERSEFDETHHWRDSVDVIQFETFVDYEISYPGNDQNPVITAVVDTNFSQSKEVVTGMVRNRYTSWNVPLTIGWQQPIRGQVFLFAETGPVFRLDSRYEGKFVFTDTATPIQVDQLSNFPMPSSTYDENIYLRQYYKDWKMDWHAALSIGWMSKSGLGYSVGVRHRRMVGETGEQHNFSHRIQSTGFNIGLQYRF